jgi:IclR family pca regulon transcriptional regulator
MPKNSSMGRVMNVNFAESARHEAGSAGATVADVAAELGKDRSQVSRGLKAALREDFLVRGERRAYALHWGLYADARALTEQRLRTDGLTALEGLVEDTGEGCFLGVLRGDSTVTVGERVPADSRMIGSWIGRPYPAYCSDAGQALLWQATDDEVRTVFSRTEFTQHGPNTPTGVEDFLDRLRAARLRGYSIVDEEAEPGLYSVAVPIHDFRGEVLAALHVVGPKSRLEPKSADCGAAVVKWGQTLEAALNGQTETSATMPVSPAPS